MRTFRKTVIQIRVEADVAYIQRNAEVIGFGRCIFVIECLSLSHSLFSTVIFIASAQASWSATGVDMTSAQASASGRRQGLY